MQTDDLIIRAQTLNGVWETIGSERGFGIVPENVQLTANEWGSDTASFDLHRDPGQLWPDIQAFTPVEVEVGGVVVWSGRVKETPTHDADYIINVQCEGWQYHLDDDAYAKSYVHSNISQWRDIRTFPNTPLDGASFPSAWQVNIDNGIVQMGLPSNTTATDQSAAGVMLDLGPSGTALRVVMTLKGGGKVNGQVRLGGSVSAPTGAAGTLGTTLLASPAPTSNTTYARTLPQASRYVYIFLVNASGATMTGDDNTWLQVSSIQVFTSTAYESGNASILKASDVVKDSCNQVTPLLSTDQSQVSTTSFAFPDLHFETAPQTARETWQAVNALHNWITKVDVDRRPVFQARPTAPLYEIGTWPGATFDDSSANSGQEVYGRVLVTGTGPDGTPVIVARGTGDQTSPVLALLTTPVPTNPSFDTNTTGWSNSGGGSITRDTGTFDTSPASLKWATSGNDVLTGTMTGTFKAGVTYQVQVRVKASVASSAIGEVDFGTATDFASTNFVAIPSGSFKTYSLTWTPKTTTTSGQIVFQTADAPVNFWIDSLVMYQVVTTITDKWGFRRTKILPIGAALNTAVGTQIGDVFIATHKTQPLQGSVVATWGGVRNVLSGETVHPAVLLRNTQQLMRLGHRIDPDNGGVGRDGTIAVVSYEHDTRTATITLDSTRKDFEALLSRFAILSPQ